MSFCHAKRLPFSLWILEESKKAWEKIKGDPEVVGELLGRCHFPASASP